MKILLINPPQIFFPGSQSVIAGLPLGIMYIAAMLEKNGYDVEILDTLIAESKPQKIGDVKYYGMTWEKIKEEIKRRKPDTVGITNPFTAQIDNAIKVSEIVKEIDAEIPTIIGGPHVSVMATQLLKDTDSVDIAVIGEGEYTMLDIMEYCKGKHDIRDIQGIAYKKGDTVILNQKRSFIKNLDDLPFPAYHLVDMEKYLNPKGVRYRSTKYMKEISMITSRGCPFNCIFCSIHLHMGKPWRGHSQEYILKHIEYVVNNYGVEHIHFEDDNFTMNTNRFEGILNGLIERNIEFSWDTPNGIRADRLNFNLLKKMKKSGCTNLTIGVESGDQFILDNVIDKHLRLENVIETAGMCKELNIPLSAFFVIGFPGENKENMKNTIEFASMLKKIYNVNFALLIATPLFGTRLYKICKENGYLTQELTPRALSEGTQVDGVGLIKTEDFTPEDVKRFATNTVSIHSRILLFDYVKHPWRNIKKGIKSPKATFQFIKRVIGI